MALSAAERQRAWRLRHPEHRARRAAHMRELRLDPEVRARKNDDAKRLRDSRRLPAPLIWLYEMWSHDHECLYVGKTATIRERLRQHKDRPQTAGGSAHAEHGYIVLSMARDPELELIQRRQPTHNLLHNGA